MILEQGRKIIDTHRKRGMHIIYLYRIYTYKNLRKIDIV